MHRITVFLIMILWAQAIPQTVFSRFPFSEDTVLKFADFLFDQKEFHRAVVEYKRYLFLRGRESDSVMFKIGRCYFAGKDHQKALSVFDRLAEHLPVSGLGFEVRMYKAFSYFYLNDYPNALSLANQLHEGNTHHPCYHTKIFLLQSVNYLALHEWPSAQKILSQVSWDTCLASARTDYFKMLENGPKMPFRKPITAAMLSGMIPGLGKIYAGRTLDGVFSLMLLSMCAWQSYDGFKNDIRSKKAYFWGTLGSIFYLGNIYGSYVAVKIHNQELQNEFRCQLQILLDNDARI